MLPTDRAHLGPLQVTEQFGVSPEPASFEVSGCAAVLAVDRPDPVPRLVVIAAARECLGGSCAEPDLRRVRCRSAPGHQPA